jgi:taurine transport system permease protein
VSTVPGVAPARGAARAAGGRRKFSRPVRIGVTIVNLALFFTLWEFLPVMMDIPKLFLPRFSEVIEQYGLLHEDGELVGNVIVSLRVYLVGMAISIGISVPLGLILGSVKFLDRVITPYIWVIYTTPMIIFMPLILLWVGINDVARVVLVVISSIPAIVVVVMEGVKTVDSALLRAARSFGADRRRLFTKVVVPSTIPFIGTGVKMGISRGLIGLFIGELFVVHEGIGYVIELAQKVFNTPRIYAMLLLFVCFCLVMVGTAQYIERKLSRWRAPQSI